MDELDRRRRAGAETRRRLLDATAEALASGGVRGVSLRAVSSAAQANVAAAKYHFGSREALIAAALSDATSQVLSAQAQQLDAVEARTDLVPVRAWLEAWAAPFVAVVVSAAPEERRLGRIIGRTLSEDTGLAPEVRRLAASADERLVRGLARALSPIDERELWLRVGVMISALAGMAGGALDPLLARSTTERGLDERLLDVLEAIVRTPLDAIC